MPAGGIADAAEVGDWPYEFQSIEVERLMIAEYQRPLTSFVKRIVTGYNPQLLMPLPVSERRKGQKYAVIDGQTRAEALSRLGKPLAPCLVYSGMTLQQEAGLFVAIQTERQAMTSASQFRAELIAGDPIAVTVQEVLNGHGMSVEVNSVDPRHFRAPIALLWVFHGGSRSQEARAKVRDPALLSRVLEIIAGAWPKLPAEAKMSVTIKGIGRYLIDHPDIKDERLIRGLSKLQPSEVAQRAVKLREGRGIMGGSSPEDFAEALEAIYKRTRAT